MAIVRPAKFVGPIDTQGAGTEERASVSLRIFFASRYALKYLSDGMSVLG